VSDSRVGKLLKMNKFALIAGMVALFSAVSVGQNNCSSAPPTGTCAAPAPPPQIWCAGNNSDSTCPGGTSWLGVTTTTAASGSWSGQLEGLDAAGILGADLIPGPQSDPNGGVGPTNSDGVGQYLEFADNFLQAFDRSTGSPIFSPKANGVAAPQAITVLFEPGGSKYCKNPSLDGIATYDRIDSVFVAANIFHPSGSNYYCIGISAATGSAPANNLQGVNGKSNWNVYAFAMNPAIPANAKGDLYFPDYARFGSWSNGFYVTWDLEDLDANYDIVGFEVCQLDKADMIAGLSASAPTCYTYIPDYVATTNNSLIHTLLPADFEGDKPIPSNSAGEYFLAQVNPSNPGSYEQCSGTTCTSNQLAFWTWSGFTSGEGPTFITVPHPYTPGCYAAAHPYNTYCIPEPYGGVIDSLGDRLNYRLAYRNLTSGGSGEYLSVAHTVQVGSYRRTGIQYDKIHASASPTIVHDGVLQDAANKYFWSMPSVAMDKNGNLGITYTVTGNTSRGSVSDYDPSPYFVTVTASGTEGTPVAILENSGMTGQDESDDFWGEYVSVSSDPNDDLTFWAVNEYMNGNQLGECSRSTNVGSGCRWATRIYTCKKGSGC
jgi:hypothetical protein